MITYKYKHHLDDIILQKRSELMELEQERMRDFKNWQHELDHEYDGLRKSKDQMLNEKRAAAVAKLMKRMGIR